MVLVAGMDVSGDLETGNHKYLGIVIATQDSMKAVFRKLGQKKIRKNDILHKNKRDEIIGGVEFGGDSIALCIRIDRDPIIKKVKQSRRLRRRPISMIIRTYHHILSKMIRERIDEFTTRHGVSPTELCVECDSDCRDLLRDAGMRQNSESDAYMIADAVAWANNRNLEPKGAVSLDLTAAIEEELIKRLPK